MHNSMAVACSDHTLISPPFAVPRTPRLRRASTGAMRSRVMSVTVYLDHAATTPMLPEAISAYAEAMAVVGNPASIHSQGQNAKRKLEEARERVAASVGSDAIEVVFTG